MNSLEVFFLIVSVLIFILHNILILEHFLNQFPCQISSKVVLWLILHKFSVAVFFKIGLVWFLLSFIIYLLKLFLFYVIGALPTYISK